MGIYALGTLPLVRKVQAEATQAWFADDASAGDKLVKVRAWWSSLCENGPRFGYHANVSKTWLVVKEPSHTTAVALFQDTGIQITTDGRPLLGAPIGTKQYTSDFISEKVDEWSHEIDTLAGIARVHPHPAYKAYTHGQANKWVYQARVSDDCADHFRKLESTLRTKLLPAVCNRTPSNIERELMGLPTRLGRLGVHDPAEMAKTHHQGACCSCHRTAGESHPPRSG